MDYSFNDLKQVIDERYNSFLNFNKSCIDYIQNVDNTNFEEYRMKIEKRGQALASFNFFKLISDKYYKENFHSDIIQFILENYPIFFDSFLTLICVDKNNYKNYDVTREKGKIDVLIKSNTHAIIIENKINWAPDQKSQIYRYYKYVKETFNIHVEKIVYLTPSKSEPSKNSLGYDVDEKEEPKKNEYIKDIENKRINIVGFEGNDNDIIYCLDKALESEKREDYRVFLKNYIDILKEKGVGDMSVQASKFLEEIKEQSKSDKDIINKLQYMKEVLDNLADGRINSWNKKFDGSEIYSSEKDGDYSCYKKYKYKDVTWQIEIYTYGYACEISNSMVLISNLYKWEENEEKEKKYQDMLMGILKEKNLLDDFSQKDKGNGDLRLYFKKEFKPILEDDKALEVALKYDKILSNLDMEK